MLSKKIITSLLSSVMFLSLSVSAQDLDNSHRSKENIERDQFRKPIETLSFFGVQPDDKVIEILPGGGWYTEILSPYLSSGQLVAVHYPVDSDVEYRKRSRMNYEKKLMENSDLYNNVMIEDFNLSTSTPEGAKNADSVLVFRALHGLQTQGKLASAFVQFNEMLKEGGKLGIVQHEAPEGYDVNFVASRGYLPKSHVISVAEAAGFRLLAESYMHNNPNDKIIQDNIKRGVWALPPSLAVDSLKEELSKVGESNRMTLIFEKM
tara:strand:+ start:2170 stop:2961 length:792 start_codon:yes stop_codon:yes gene_type:complete